MPTFLFYYSTYLPDVDGGAIIIKYLINAYDITKAKKNFKQYMDKNIVMFKKIYLEIANGKLKTELIGYEVKEKLNDEPETIELLNKIMDDVREHVVMLAELDVTAEIDNIVEVDNDIFGSANCKYSDGVGGYHDLDFLSAKKENLMAMFCGDNKNKHTMYDVLYKIYYHSMLDKFAKYVKWNNHIYDYY